MIVLMKKGKIDRPIKFFNEWYYGAKWVNENIKVDIEKYYFQEVGWLKKLRLKMYLIIYNKLNE
jgi:hypothetical protein